DLHARAGNQAGRGHVEEARARGAAAVDGAGLARGVVVDVDLRAAVGAAGGGLDAEGNFVRLGEIQLAPAGAGVGAGGGVFLRIRAGGGQRRERLGDAEPRVAHQQCRVAAVADDAEAGLVIHGNVPLGIVAVEKATGRVVESGARVVRV